MKMKALVKRKVFRITLTLVLCGVGAFLVISAFRSESIQVPETQTASVQRGNLTVDISGAGNLSLSHTEDLAFNIPAGMTVITVEEVLVEEGESVEEGQVLAKLDTSEWARALKDLENQITTKKRDLLQAQINLENAEYALDTAKEETTTSIVGDVVVKESADSREIDMKELQVELAKGRVEDAKESLEEAQQELEEAQATSPEITAPFAGFITTVNVEGGDEVKTGTVAVSIADPNKFEADILVSEMDILQVKLGGEAQVQVDAMSGLSLPAKVTHISPTATIQSGVVNYKVKVEVESLETVMQEQQQAMQQAGQGATSGELPEAIQKAIEEGRMTQEQAEAMMKQRQQAGQGTQRQIPTTVPAAVSQNVQLREGLTVTVSIIVDQRTNVLLVSNGAITSQGRQTYVQVLSPDGTIEQRVITTGISDWQYTEVTDGLSEGEQVVVPQGTASTSTTSQQGQRPNEVFIPGMGRFGG